VRFTPDFTVPYNSSCNDINDYANAWRNICGSGIVATDVLNGTRFRIESSTADGDYYRLDILD